MKKRWVVFAASCLINLCLGSIYAWSVLAGGMAEYLSAYTGNTITTGDLAIVYTVANSVGPITMISGGFFNDKFGPKKVILTGGLLFGAGMILSGFAHSVGNLILTYGIVSGLGLGMAYGTTVSTCMKFFPDKRGIIGGITTAVYGLGSVVLPPSVTAILQVSDGAQAFKILGAVFLRIVCGASLFMEQCPADFVPEGYQQQAGASAPAAVNKSWKEMLCSPEFYVMLPLFTCGAFSGMMIISQASAVATNQIGMSAAMASAAVSVLALFNASGRIIAGTLSDRIGRVNTLTIAAGLSICGLLSLFLAGEGEYVPFYLGLAIVGLCFGAFMGIYPGFTADCFGTKNNSVNYGIMFIGVALAGYFGPTIMRSIYNADASYGRAFLIAGIFGLAGLILTFVYRLITKSKK
ncbi:MAG: OFA family MFS transporter [Lachnospiraceae bacterium]|nr:OFA family MFS transporter [Lachnospiraceae bacterium]